MPSCERAPTDAFITSKCVLTSDSVVDAWVVEAFINICEKINIFLPLLPLSIASCGLYISYLFSQYLLTIEIGVLTKNIYVREGVSCRHLSP